FRNQRYLSEHSDEVVIIIGSQESRFTQQLVLFCFVHVDVGYFSDGKVGVCDTPITTIPVCHTITVVGIIYKIPDNKAVLSLSQFGVCQSGLKFEHQPGAATVTATSYVSQALVNGIYSAFR